MTLGWYYPIFSWGKGKLMEPSLSHIKEKRQKGDGGHISRGAALTIYYKMYIWNGPLTRNNLLCKHRTTWGREEQARHSQTINMWFIFIFWRTLYIEQEGEMKAREKKGNKEKRFIQRWRSSVTCNPTGAGRSPQVIFPRRKEAALRPSTSSQTIAPAPPFQLDPCALPHTRIQRH